MKLAERIVMVALVLVIVGGGAWLYFSVHYKREAIKDAVARGEYEIKTDDNRDEITTEKDIMEYYPGLIAATIGSTTVRASVADSVPERIKGLSDTPALPADVVKLFVFGAEGEHSIWMKDMNYALDIMWADKDGTIIHMKENISPDTYPESFAPSRPAWYVIEANAGFVASSSIKIGDKFVIS